MADHTPETVLTPPGTTAPARYDHLPLLQRQVAEFSTKPKWGVYLAVALAVLLAWFWLLVMVVGFEAGLGAGPDTGLGPISSVFRDWLAPLMPDVSTSPIIAFVLKICTPQSIQSLSLGAFFSIALMWMLMSVAMMLPSAAPMLRTYADIADVAAQKGEPVVSVLVLAGGYLATWGLFSLLAAAAQMALMAIGWIADPVFPVQSFLGGIILIGAGLYQFSTLKNACLEKCRNPFSILFGRWSSETSGVFKLGTEQGLYCVGCCWALMLVMLVVGTMNLAWMAFFALFTIAEKSGKGPVTSRWSGGILLVWGAALVLISVMPVSLPAN